MCGVRGGGSVWGGGRWQCNLDTSFIALKTLNPTHKERNS